MPLAGHVRLKGGQQLGHDPGAIIVGETKRFPEEAIDGIIRRSVLVGSLLEDEASAPEGSHPRPSLFDEHPWAHNPHTLSRSEVPHVVGHQERRAGTDRRGEDRHVLLVSQGASPFPVLSRGPIDPHRYRAEELLKERQGLRQLVSQVPPDLIDDGLRKVQPEEADLTKDQDGVARTRAG
jgi:hypothetical protein